MSPSSIAAGLGVLGLVIGAERERDKVHGRAELLTRNAGQYLQEVLLDGTVVRDGWCPWGCEGHCASALHALQRWGSTLLITHASSTVLNPCEQYCT